MKGGIKMTDLIQPEELYQRLGSDQPPVVIDVRGIEAYRAGHIPGALHIPREEIADPMAEFPKNRPVVTY
jgi:rhodanese-related sulfurtransferase